MSMQLDFQGEIVLVTGGATGLGLAIAQAFAAAGASIALNDRDPARVEAACESLREFSVPCLGCPADVRDTGAVAACLETIERELGTPSIVVANAGLYPNTPFLELSETEWDRVIDTNLKGVFLVCQAAARSMVRVSAGGKIIVIASTAAQRAIRGWSHYCASKAAAVMLARAMALELGTHGIRVNAVLPGYIDVAEGGRHLASPLADYVSGAALVVDGGARAGPIGLRPIDS